jgi:hypothetical protein
MIAEVIALCAIGGALAWRAIAETGKARQAEWERWQIGRVRAQRAREAHQDVLAEWERDGKLRPLIPTCASCGAWLMFSARLRGDGLCGPCSRSA